MLITLRGHDALAYVEQLDLDCGLRKFADPTEGELRHLSLDQAREIAREDPSLIHFVADTENPAHDAIMERVRG